MAYDDGRLQAAKDVRMEDLVTRAGYTPVRHGSVFVLKEHDSFVIFPQTNSFCHYSQPGKNGYSGGSTIDFCMKYMAMEFKEALDYLCEIAGYKGRSSPGKEYETKRKSGAVRGMASGMQVVIPRREDLKLDRKADRGARTVQLDAEVLEDKEGMKLPPKNKDNRRVWAYLVKTRGIDSDVVNAFIKSGRLYESADHHNCVFVTYDANGLPAYAFQRGTNPLKSFKKDVFGSDKLTGFPILREGSARLLVFEAPIDMMSYLSLYPKDRSSMIALGCLSPRGLYHFLDQHREIRTVSLLLDNDEAAKKVIPKITEKLKTFDYEVEHHKLRDEMKRVQVKDINEFLLAVRKTSPTVEVHKSRSRS